MLGIIGYLISSIECIWGGNKLLNKEAPRKYHYETQKEYDRASNFYILAMLLGLVAIIFGIIFAAIFLIKVIGV